MAKKKRNIINADEINVGPIRITTTDDGGAGIWFGTGENAPMIALFQTSGQVGIGIYRDNEASPCSICLLVNDRGEGAIQFAKTNGETTFLTFDQVRALAK